ncbi:hypothetical protein V6N13_018922 [Hibiscus sabdariffa]
MWAWCEMVLCLSQILWFCHRFQNIGVDKELLVGTGLGAEIMYCADLVGSWWCMSVAALLCVYGLHENEVMLDDRQLPMSEEFFLEKLRPFSWVRVVPSSWSIVESFWWLCYEIRRVWRTSRTQSGYAWGSLTMAFLVDFCEY